MPSSLTCWPQQQLESSATAGAHFFPRGPCVSTGLGFGLSHFKAEVVWVGALKCGKYTAAHPPTFWGKCFREKRWTLSQNDTCLNKCAMTTRWVNSASSSSLTCWPQQQFESSATAGAHSFPRGPWVSTPPYSTRITLQEFAFQSFKPD
jgi:hypothetical protein